MDKKRINTYDPWYKLAKVMAYEGIEGQEPWDKLFTDEARERVRKERIARLEAEMKEVFR